MVDYKNTLTEMKDATESFESHPSGFVSQEFLEQDVTDGFNKDIIKHDNISFKQ